MACFPNLAKQLSPDCDTIIKTGWTGRAILYQYSAGIVILVGNAGTYVSNISGSAPKVKFELESMNAFNGTSVVGNADNGKIAFTKTVSLRIPRDIIGKSNSKVLTPLALDAQGFLVLLERRDGKTIVFGSQDPCVADLSSFSQNEYENGGDYILNLTCTEKVAEVYSLGRFPWD